MGRYAGRRRSHSGDGFAYASSVTEAILHMRSMAGLCARMALMVASSWGSNGRVLREAFSSAGGRRADPQDPCGARPEDQKRPEEPSVDRGGRETG